MSASDIRTVTIVGTGVIGASWASLCLAKGFDVIATDPAPGAEARLRALIERNWPSLIEIGLAEGASADRLRFEPDSAKAVASADFVQENGPERQDIKIELLRNIEPALLDHAVVASSSSMLEITPIQRQLARPDRVILGHPFNPPHLIPLVEVVGGDHGSPEAIATAIGFYERLGRKPIHVRKEVKGHIGNRLQAALFKEAFHLVESGVVTTAELDIALAHGPGLRWALLGPFLNLHLSGGEGGIRHTFAHLGTVIETLWKEAVTPEWTDAMTDGIAAQVEAELAGSSLAETVAERDRLLIELLRAKAASPAIP